MKNHVFIMISGPAASGKSTLVQGINHNLSCFVFKPAQSFIELAKRNNIDISRAFTDVSQAEANDYFTNVCKRNKIVLGDQHLAIQPKKDSNLATSYIADSSMQEPYVSALDYALFDKLNENEIFTKLLYLQANPELLYERMIQRNKKDGTPIRNRSLGEMIEESEMERYFFEKLIKEKQLDHKVIDIDSKTQNEVLDEALQQIDEFQR